MATESWGCQPAPLPEDRFEFLSEDLRFDLDQTTLLWQVEEGDYRQLSVIEDRRMK
jgi:hypothetical protein